MKLIDIDSAKELADDLLVLDAVVSYVHQQKTNIGAGKTTSMQISVECHGDHTLIISNRPFVLTALLNGLQDERGRILGELATLGVEE